MTFQKLRSTHVLIVPGIDGSGPEHWQTLWERADPVRVRRVEPSEQDRDRLRHGKPARELPPVPETVLLNLRSQLSTAGF